MSDISAISRLGHAFDSPERDLSRDKRSSTTEYYTMDPNTPYGVVPVPSSEVERVVNTMKQDVGKVRHVQVTQVEEDRPRSGSSRRK
ncbi:hypothetical protein NM688_g6939 [Phlebia brevispora]|uniref:Uncharacterized protein n=1 Tax=Phlebia brevispora TaxID=194682 RepID=A0ACC1SAN8_9APHY|nr:hypothetical protein NM688_g6939 [Phlebia brevispora]